MNWVGRLELMESNMHGRKIVGSIPDGVIGIFY